MLISSSKSPTKDTITSTNPYRPKTTFANGQPNKRKLRLKWKNGKNGKVYF